MTDTRGSGRDLEDERTPAEWRRMLLEYRLGEMDEARIEEIDERLITDEEFAAGMQATEYDLLDAYAADELGADERARVERALEPQGRFSPAAPGLMIGGPPAPVAVMPVRSVSQRKVAPWKWVLPIAAAVLLAIGLPLAWRAGRGGTQSAAAPPAPASSGSPGMERRVGPEAHLATVLLPSAVRSPGALPVRIGDDTEQVQFQWVVPDGATTGYELQVVTPNGKQECRNRGVRADSGVVDFVCPAAAIASGDAFVRVLPAGASVDDVPLLETAVTVRR